MIDNQHRVRHRPVIRVFVSSTFTDLKHERDALQQSVFPQLERLCAARGFQFQAIDLRWGVPTEASLDHRTMRICFEELRRSQEISPLPNFLILLGNRYGWRPLPEEISEEEFKILEEKAKGVGAEGTLWQWYAKDENALPRALYILQSRKNAFPDGKNYTDEQVWNKVQDVLWQIINLAFPAEQLAGRFEHAATLDASLPAVVRFQASATEQEIWRGALAVPNAKQHVLAFIRDIGNLQEFSREPQVKAFVDVDPASGNFDQLAGDALQELKRKLREQLGSNVFEAGNVALGRSTNEKGESILDVPTDITAGHLKDLCDRVLTGLTAIIQQQIDAYWGETERPLRTLELEQLEHRRFADERAPAQTFVGRDAQLEAIRTYLRNDSHQPLVIHGTNGCGKTALLARASQEVADDWKPLVRFIGVTPHASDVRGLLGSLCQELRQRHPREDELPGDVRELIRELREHLAAATPEQPLPFSSTPWINWPTRTTAVR